MKQRTRTLPVLVTVAVLALVLGTIGTAAVAAPGLTERAVKKIAAKVVKKQAKRLEVKDAKNLGGLPPAAYQTQVITIGIANVANTANFDKTLPAVPAGTYQANLYLSASMSSSSASLFCTIYQTGVAQDLVDGYGASYTSGGNFRIVSASRTIAVSGPLHLQCRTSSGSIVAIPADASYAPAQISLQKVDSAPYAGTAP